jgi:elongation factor P hydroxylase
LLDGEYENGNATQTDIEINGKTYRIINVYLQPFRFDKSMVKLNGDSEEDEQKLKDIVRKLIPTFKIHQEQIVPIRESIESSPYPVIWREILILFLIRMNIMNCQKILKMLL